MTKLTIKSAFILLLIIAFSSCIKEDTSDCPVRHADVNIMFEYYADSKDNLITEYVESVNLYIYDKRDGLLVKEYKFLKEKFKNGSKLNLKGLAEGDYTFVLWGNLTTQTQIQQPQNIELARLSPKGYLDDAKVQTNDALYFARNDFSIQLRKTNTLKMELKSSHLTFEISVSGITQLPDITADNLAPQFDMNNQPVGSEDYMYHPKVSYSDALKVYQTKFRVLKPKQIIDSRIHITFPGSTSLHIEDISSFIAKYYPDYKLNERQEITFKIHINLTESGIIITVPNWSIDDGGSEVE